MTLWQTKKWCPKCYNSATIKRHHNPSRIELECGDCGEEMVGYNPEKYAKLDGELVRREKVTVADGGKTSFLCKVRGVLSL